MKPLPLFSLLGGSVAAIWFSYPWLINSPLAHLIVPTSNWTTRGVVGDSFGALNTLFAGLALAGLVVNIYLQSIQLKKLELREEDNEKLIKAQASAIRDTALLNYYNSEIDRLDRHSIEVESGADPDKAERFWAKLAELRARRDDLVKLIDASRER